MPDQLMTKLLRESLSMTIGIIIFVLKGFLQTPLLLRCGSPNLRDDF